MTRRSQARARARSRPRQGRGRRGAGRWGCGVERGGSEEAYEGVDDGGGDVERFGAGADCEEVGRETREGGEGLPSGRTARGFITAGELAGNDGGPKLTLSQVVGGAGSRFIQEGK